MSLIDIRSRNFWPVRIATALFIVSLIAAMAFAENQAQNNARRDLEDRFALRATTASTFLKTYITDTLQREQELAKLRLGNPTVTHEQFLDFLDDFGFGPSTLLDENGKILDVAPYKAELIGTKATEEYSHLQLAVNGTPNVSNVVPSTTLRFPIVAFTTPYQSQVGTRVISGAFDLTTQPLGTFLINALPYQGQSAVYLLDESNNIIVSSFDDVNTLKDGNAPTNVSEVEKIQDVDKGFTGIKGSSQKGHYTSRIGKNTSDAFYASRKIDGTPWRIVMSVENDALYEPVRGSNSFLPWIFIASFAIVAIILSIILVRGRERRLRLQDVALIDLLTGIYNPRGIKSHLTRALSGARRHDTDLAIFTVDIDDFKKINEKHGHSSGDDVLIQIAEQIQNRLRTEDIVGRWGGEEFLVILPDTDIPGASIVAERIVSGVSEEVRVEGDNDPITISIGISMRTKDDTLETLVARADEAMRDAKATGKNKLSSK